MSHAQSLPTAPAGSRRLIKSTTSRCPRCFEPAPAEVVEIDNRVEMRKVCPEHGEFRVRLASDARFYFESHGSPENAGLSCRGSDGCCGSPGRRVGAHHVDDISRFDTLSTCLALIEIVDSCNLKCPTCYAASPWGVNDSVDCISFDEYVGRVQGVIDRKGFIDILQLTGGEPTMHPEFARLLEWALRHDEIGYVLINTNGLRIAQDRAFRARLADLRRDVGPLELYLQFDGPQSSGQLELRGEDLREIRRRAIDESGAFGIPTTLAMTVTPTTIRYLGEALQFGFQRRHCRGISFQPMFTSGRVPPTVESSTGLPIYREESATPLSVADVIRCLVEQSEGLLSTDDFTPLPCGDPNCHTIGYLLRTEDGAVGLSKLLDLESLKGFLRDRVNYNLEDLASCGCESEPLGQLLKQFEIEADQPFRLFIKPFMDAWTWDEDRIDRCCTHVIRPDGMLDSFCRYYLLGHEMARGTQT